MSAFTQTFEILIGHEGTYTDDPNDPGNWTGGAPGRGVCKGTKYGISAASYPMMDIANLTLADSRALYKRDYWDPLACDIMDPGLALIAFDAAVNCGLGRAIRWLQTAVGTAADGVIGSETRRKIQQMDPATALAALHAQRINYMAQLPTWARYGAGWSKRLASLPMQAADMMGGRNGETQHQSA